MESPTPGIEAICLPVLGEGSLDKRGDYNVDMAKPGELKAGLNIGFGKRESVKKPRRDGADFWEKNPGEWGAGLGLIMRVD